MIVPIVVAIFVVAIVAVVPVTICVPTALVAFPPSVIPPPAVLPRIPKVLSLFLRLMTALAVFLDRLVQLGFCALNFFLALPVVVRVGIRLRDTHQHRPT
jgi:hypothetical protein